jgi:hypothetical protein
MSAFGSKADITPFQGNVCFLTQSGHGPGTHYFIVTPAGATAAGMFGAVAMGLTLVSHSVIVRRIGAMLSS